MSEHEVDGFVLAVQWPDERLHAKCPAAVLVGPDGEQVWQPEVFEVAERLEHVARHDWRVAGFAAPQLGVMLRVIAIVLQAGVRKAGKVTQHPDVCVVVNPTVTTSGGWWSGVEGCFSHEGHVARTTRRERVRLRGFTVGGRPVDLKLLGGAGRAAQHEVDHLDGVTIADHSALLPIPEDRAQTTKDVMDRFLAGAS